MKLIVAVLLITSCAFAGRVVPNIEWNQTRINASGSAAAFGNRDNNLSLAYADGSSEDQDDSDNDYKTKNTGLINFYRTDDYTLEVAGLMYKFDYDDFSDTYGNIFLGNLGKKYDNLSVGLSMLHLNFSGFNSYTLIASTTYRVSDLYVGFSVDQVFNNNNDFSYLGYYAGVGYMNSKMAIEAVLGYQPSAKKKDGNTTSYADAETSLTVEGSINLNRFQLTPRIYISKEVDKDDDIYRSNDISLKGEFLISKMFFVGANLGIEKRIYESDVDSDFDDTATTNNLGLSARLKKDAYQVEFRYDTDKITTVYEDGSDDDKNDERTITLLASLFY